MKKVNLEESILIRQLQDPSTREAAFEGMVRLFQQPVYWHIRKMVHKHEDADDLLQNTFIKVWKNLDKFRGESKLRTWVYRIATNETLTFIEREKKRGHRDLSEVEDHIGHSHTGAAPDDGDQIQEKLLRAVAQLPDKQRLVFNMKYFDELKYEEMAEILGGSVGSLKASFHHAVKKIEQILTGELNPLG